MKISTRAFTISELLMVFAAAILVVLLLFPFMKHTKRRMEKIMCADNLQETGLALYIYAREHDGKFPPTLKALYTGEYLSDARLMDCPASKEVGTLDAPDYIYTAGLTVRDASSAQLLRDKTGNHGGEGKNVMYVNGKIGWEK